MPVSKTATPCLNRKKPARNQKAVSPIISTIIITSVLLTILVIASFVSTNILDLQIAGAEFEQAKTNMVLLDQVIQDVALRPGSSSYVQFNQRTGGIGVYENTEKFTILGPQKQTTSTLTLRPNAQGTNRDWDVNGATSWGATSDQDDSTYIYTTVLNKKETENLNDTAQTGLINSVKAYVRATASATDRTLNPILNMNFTGNASGWSTTTSGNATDLTYGYSDNAGNPYGSKAGSYHHKATNNKGNSVDVTFTTTTTFSISLGVVKSAVLSYAYNLTGSADPDSGSNLTIRIVKPDNSIADLAHVTLSNNASWTYVRGINVATENFTQSGTYKLQVVNRLVIPRKSYLELYFDDVGLSITQDQPETINIAWRTHAQDYESAPFTISRSGYGVCFEDRTINPYTQQKWTWDEINALEIGVRVSALDEKERVQVSELWVEINYTSFQPEVIYDSSNYGSLFSIVYRGGSKVSTADIDLAGNTLPVVNMSGSLGYVRVRVGDGARILLDYFRVRLVTNTTLVVGNVSYNLTEISLIRIEKGTMGGSGTVNFKVWNKGVRNVYTGNYTEPITMPIRVGDEEEQLTIASTSGLRSIVVVTETVIEVSTA